VQLFQVRLLIGPVTVSLELPALVISPSAEASLHVSSVSPSAPVSLIC
jgi:hypothetical protein